MGVRQFKVNFKLDFILNFSLQHARLVWHMGDRPEAYSWLLSGTCNIGLEIWGGDMLTMNCKGLVVQTKRWLSVTFLCELIIKQIAISWQLSKHKLKHPFTQIDEIKKKKLTWGPPISHFSYFLVNQLQDQPLFQKKKLTGVPLYKAF